MALPEGKINARRRRQMISETFGVGRQRRAPPPSLPPSQSVHATWGCGAPCGGGGGGDPYRQQHSFFAPEGRWRQACHPFLSTYLLHFMAKKVLIVISLLSYSSSPTEHKKLICPLSFEDYNHNPSLPSLPCTKPLITLWEGEGEEGGSSHHFVLGLSNGLSSASARGFRGRMSDRNGAHEE